MCYPLPEREGGFSVAGDLPQEETDIVAVKVELGTRFRQFTGNEDSLELQGCIIADMLDELESRFPQMRGKVRSESGQLRQVNIFVNGKNIRMLQGIQTPLQDGDEVSLIPTIGGG